jgi:YD repeat-containing protein
MQDYVSGSSRTKRGAHNPALSSPRIYRLAPLLLAPLILLAITVYDPAGNLTHDSYTGKGNRIYDAENRMTSAVSDIYGNSSVYTYDASGRRMRRSTPTAQVWQVSGFDGELMAEYAANSAPAQPQKEYAYRSGELLEAISKIGSEQNQDTAEMHKA